MILAAHKLFNETTWSKLLAIAAVGYLLAPLDLIADACPFGLLDDALLVPLLCATAIFLWPRQVFSYVRVVLQSILTMLAMASTALNCAPAHAARVIPVTRLSNSQRFGLSSRLLLADGGAGGGALLPFSSPVIGPVPGVGLSGSAASPLVPDPVAAPYSEEALEAPLHLDTIRPKPKPQHWTTDAAPAANIAGDSLTVGKDNTTATLKSTVSQTDKSLGIVDALDEALLRSPRAAAIRATLGIARSNLAYATVQRNSAFFFDRGLVAEAVRRIGPTFTWTPPWEVAFDLLVAKRQIDQAKFEILRDLWSLRADVRRAYTDVVVSQEMAMATNNLVELAERTVVVTSKRFQAGAVPEFDVLKARLAKEQAELDLKPAQQRVIKAKQKLNLLLGRLPKQSIAIPSIASADSVGPRDPKRNYFLPDLKEMIPDLEVFMEQARKSRWDLTALGQQIKVNKAQLQNAYGSIMPSPQLILGQSVSGNQPSGPKVSASFFTINAELPTNNFQQGDIAKFKATAKQLKWQMESQKNQVYTELSDAYNDLITYRERIRLYQERVLADSSETARLSRRSYETGRSDITSVIQSQQENFQIQLQYLADVQAYQQAFISLEQAIGRPLQ